MRDCDVGEEQSLLEYPYFITQIYLAMGLQELPAIYEMLEAMNTTNLGLIRDATNFLAGQDQHTIDMVADMFRQRGQAETVEAAEIGD